MASDLTKVLNTIAKYNYNTFIHTHKQIKLHNNWYVTLNMFKFSVTYKYAQTQTNLNKQLHNITKWSQL